VIRKNIILIKYVQKWVDQKLLKNPIKKRFSIVHQKTKVKKMSSPKNEKVEKI
jgi:hypothetical protein